MAEMTRRNFLAGAAAAGVVAAGATMALADIDGAIKEPVEAGKEWAAYPGDITPDREEECDVLVIGCGFSGSVAAVSAAEKGA